MARTKGSQNKDVAAIRVAIESFVSGNVDRLNGWLDQIALNDPQAAFKCVSDLLEYHVPKLARTEHTGADGKDLTLNVTYQVINADKPVNS